MIFYGFCLSIVCPHHPHTDMQSTDSLILFDCKYLISLYEHPEPHSCIIYLYYAAVVYVGDRGYIQGFVYIHRIIPTLFAYFLASHLYTFLIFFLVLQYLYAPCTLLAGIYPQECLPSLVHQCTTGGCCILPIHLTTRQPSLVICPVLTGRG